VGGPKQFWLLALSPDTLEPLAVRTMPEWETIVGAIDQHGKAKFTPLDCAEVLRVAGCSPQKTYLIEQRSARMVTLLSKYRPEDASARTRDAVSATNADSDSHRMPPRR
jgi:hypothetical protein